MEFIQSIRDSVRSVMNTVAKTLNGLSGGRVTPNSITIFGFLAHIPIALLIADGRLVLSALLLAFFGLFDALDGALARLQGKSSPAGMLLDASTDRMKEVLVYAGSAFYLTQSDQPELAYIAVLACGFSLCVSYVKAKGESAIATSGQKVDHAKLNRMFSDGLASFDVRIFLLILGLLADQLMITLLIITVLSLTTALSRLARISKAINS